MADFIIDTNVAVVANMQNEHVASNCIDACIGLIASIPGNHRIIIDDSDQVRTEYAGALAMGKPFQLGAQFLVHVLRHQFDSKHVLRLAMEKLEDGSFADFPMSPGLARFDPSDRKFVALSVRSGVPVTNAVDSDWADSAQELQAAGVEVNFLCGSDKSTWLK